MNRLLEMSLAIVVAVLAAFPAALVAVAIKLTSRGPVLYWSTRIGRGNEHFEMPKFRTMRVGTPAVASHLLADAGSVLTPIGSLLRRTSLDEIPQLWSVLRGQMSFVGPRPALFNQHDLVELRTLYGIDALKPGITGWAQVKGRDTLAILEKVEYDREYLARRNLPFDLRIMMLTALKVFGDKTVSH